MSLQNDIERALIRAGCTRRDPKKLSTTVAQEKTGVQGRTIERILAGDQSPTIGTLQRIFEPLGLEVVVAFRKRRQDANSRPHDAV